MAVTEFRQQIFGEFRMGGKQPDIGETRCVCDIAEMDADALQFAQDRATVSRGRRGVHTDGLLDGAGISHGVRDASARSASADKTQGFLRAFAAYTV